MAENLNGVSDKIGKGSRRMFYIGPKAYRFMYIHASNVQHKWTFYTRRHGPLQRGGPSRPPTQPQLYRKLFVCVPKRKSYFRRPRGVRGEYFLRRFRPINQPAAVYASTANRISVRLFVTSRIDDDAGRKIRRLFSATPRSATRFRGNGQYDIVEEVYII